MQFPESFIEGIEHLCRRPGMYGIKSTNEVLAYIQGWLHCANLDLVEFQRWVTKKYKEPPANHWVGILEQKFCNANLIEMIEIFKEFNNSDSNENSKLHSNSSKRKKKGSSNL